MLARILRLSLAISLAACSGPGSRAVTTEGVVTTTVPVSTTARPTTSSGAATTSTLHSALPERVRPVAVASGPLHERVPGLVDDLQWVTEVFALNEAETAIDLLIGFHSWALDEEEPGPDPSFFEFVGTPEYSSHDSSRAFFAVVTKLDLFDIPNLVVADASGVTTVSETVRWGATWHPTRPSLAYLEQAGDDEVLLRVADITPGDDGPVAMTTTLAAVPSLSAVMLGFDDRGFLIAVEDHWGAALYRLGPDGVPVMAAEVWLLAWLGSDRMLVEPSVIDGAPFYDIEPTPVQGDRHILDLSFRAVPAADETLALLRESEFLDDIFIAPIDSDRFAVIDLSGSPEETLVTVASLEEGVLSSLVVEDVWAPSGFVGAGRYAVFQMDNGDFLFLDWKKGTAITTPAVDPVPEDPYAPITRVVAVSEG